MRCAITYIHHNAFVLRTGDRAFLFDYPEDEHLPEGAGEAVRNAVAGTDLVVFISHGHGDHLNGDLPSVAGTAARVRFVLSDDVGELRPEAVPTGGEVLMVEPDERYELDGMRIETLMSNDLGVAFLVADRGFRFYYGGDLAKWIWPGADRREAAFTENFFAEAMERARRFAPHVAFGNADGRLANLAGGAEACRSIGAPIFVPMHVFGDTAILKAFAEAASGCRSRLFLYARCGDSEEFSF